MLETNLIGTKVSFSEYSIASKNIESYEGVIRGIAVIDNDVLYIVQLSSGLIRELRATYGLKVNEDQNPQSR